MSDCDDVSSSTGETSCWKQIASFWNVLFRNVEENENETDGVANESANENDVESPWTCRSDRRQLRERSQDSRVGVEPEQPTSGDATGDQRQHQSPRQCLQR